MKKQDIKGFEAKIKVKRKRRALYAVPVNVEIYPMYGHT